MDWYEVVERQGGQLEGDYNSFSKQEGHWTQMEVTEMEFFIW